MKIRLARDTDLGAVVEIYNQAVRELATADTETVTVESRRSWFAGHTADRRPILVAEDQGKILGWISLSDHRPGRQAVRHTAEISYYVHRDHRRKNVASQLVRAAIERCAGLEIKTLFAILLEDNTGSIRLLEGLDFEEWGRLPRVADFDGREVGQLYYGLRVG
jgi:phosphinothricin acetyltransferase